jgi:hypothetical protein
MSVKRLVMSLLREFGGVNGVVAEWIAAHESATGLYASEALMGCFGLCVGWTRVNRSQVSWTTNHLTSG